MVRSSFSSVRLHSRLWCLSWFAALYRHGYEWWQDISLVFLLLLKSFNCSGRLADEMEALKCSWCFGFVSYYTWCQHLSRAVFREVDYEKAFGHPMVARGDLAITKLPLATEMFKVAKLLLLVLIAVQLEFGEEGFSSWLGVWQADCTSKFLSTMLEWHVIRLAQDLELDVLSSMFILIAWIWGRLYTHNAFSSSGLVLFWFVAPWWAWARSCQ